MGEIGCCSQCRYGWKCLQSKRWTENVFFSTKTILWDSSICSKVKHEPLRNCGWQIDKIWKTTVSMVDFLTDWESPNGSSWPLDRLFSFFFLFWQHRYWGIIHIHSVGHLKWRTPWFLLCSLHWAAITTVNFRIEILEQSNLLCFAYSGDFLLIESHNMWSSVIGFFPLASCLQGSSML